MNKSIELDVCVDDAAEHKEYIENKYKGIKVEILTECGSGGGDPVMKFVGPIEKLIEMYTHDYHACETLDEALAEDGFEQFDELLDD